MKKLSKSLKRRAAKITLFGGLLLVAGIASLHYDQRVAADNTYFAVVSGTAFEQNWTNIGLITADDIWTGVPSINGYRGDDLTTVTATDPQTLLADGSATPLDVIANQANPNTQATGGVAEFDGIANPAVALQGSGTADAPFIDIRLDTSNCVAPNRLNLTYNIRDLDGSADNAIQPVALHYRVGNAGAYTNEPAGFVADATTGPSINTLVTPIALTLNAALLGQPQVHLRIMTTNAVGNDEWVGIDDIKVVCGVASAANASLGGRVQAANGAGISKARVQISGGSLAQPMYALTNAFGYYTFGELQTGQSYTVSVIAKGRTFNQPTQIVTLGDDLSNVDFTALD